MKHFIIEINYRIPAEQIGDVVAEHRAFLKGGYECGWLLFSWPKTPKTGGMIVARAPSQQELEQFFSAKRRGGCQLQHPYLDGPDGCEPGIGTGCTLAGDQPVELCGA